MLEAPDCKTNSPCHYRRKYEDYCVENMDTNVLV